MNKIVLTLTIMLTIGSTAHAMQHACAMNKKQHGGKKVLQNSKAQFEALSRAAQAHTKSAERTKSFYALAPKVGPALVLLAALMAISVIQPAEAWHPRLPKIRNCACNHLPCPACDGTWMNDYVGPFYNPGVMLINDDFIGHGHVDLF
ncbi:MAG: hypothetical protein UU47_C0012G0006 [candidate division TM6 bacterium GW2011_GWE2_41_16]|nr:MAG: hypothetical protein UU47_C0012G0006 [candidate division TM6 bacterium GW2011_GWE2_41_16]